MTLTVCGKTGPESGKQVSKLPVTCNQVSVTGLLPSVPCI